MTEACRRGAVPFIDASAKAGVKCSERPLLESSMPVRMSAFASPQPAARPRALLPGAAPRLLAKMSRMSFRRRW